MDEQKSVNDSWRKHFTDSVNSFCKAHSAAHNLHADGWLHTIEWNGIKHHLIGYDIGLNSSTAFQIARDKSAASEIMSIANIPHVPHIAIFKPGTQSSQNEKNKDIIYSLFSEWGSDVVIKPNKGAGGSGVVRVNTDIRDCILAIDSLFLTNRSVAISPYIQAIAEYRVTVLDSEVIHIYKKVRGPNSIDFRLNLAHGALAVEVLASEALDARSMAVSALKSIGGRFMNIDILETTTDYKIMELNGTVTFEKYADNGIKEKKHTERVYHSALRKLFSV